MTVLVTREYPEIKRSIQEIFRYFDGSIDASRGFFLKPNIVFPVTPDSGQITRPVVVRAVIETLRERYGDVQIIIGEGTAHGTVPEENFAVSGYSDLASELGVQLLNLNVVEKKKIPWEYGEIEIPCIALEHVHINLPILKISSAAIFSGAIKNTKGLIPPVKKKQFHRMGLHGPLAALAKIISPDLTILDCHNFFRRRNIFLSGTDICKIDLLVIKLFNFEEPDYLSILKQQGLAAEIGPVVNENLLHYETRRRFHKKYRRFLNIRLWSNPRACSQCRQTMQSLKEFRGGNFRDSLSFYLKLAKYAITGADFIFGSKPVFNEHASNVICIGECTRAIAKQRGCRHIPGCPPTRADFEKYF